MSAQDTKACAHCKRMPGDPEGMCDWIECPVGYGAESQVHPDSALPHIAQPGVKFDGGKLRYSLLPQGTVGKVVEVLEFGARKYAADNWKHVPDARARYYDATQRHIDAWWNGEHADPETGLPHLAHAVCCLLFLMWFEQRAAAAPSAVGSDAKTTTRCDESGHKDICKHEFIYQAGAQDIFCKHCLAPIAKA